MKDLPIPTKWYSRAHFTLAQRWGYRLKAFVIIAVLAWLFCPKVFYGVTDTIGRVIGYTVESRIDYVIRRKHGDTVAGLRKAGKIWYKNFEVLRHPVKWFV